MNGSRIYNSKINGQEVLNMHTEGESGACVISLFSVLQLKQQFIIHNSFTAFTECSSTIIP